MADLIVGEPTNLTVVMDNGAGFVRVLLDPWELDWEFFGLLATDGTHFLANTTTAASAAITAKGGQEHLGYWFDINVAFPSVAWNTADRITPQRQAAISQFANFPAGVGGLVNDDVLLGWYPSTSEDEVHYTTTLDFNNKGGGIWGMLSSSRVTIATGSVICQYRGNLAGMTVQAPFKNISAIGNAFNNGITFNPNAAQEGPGLDIDRYLGYNVPLRIQRATAGTINIRNSRFFCIHGFLWAIYIDAAGTQQNIYNNTALFCINGFQVNNSAGRNLVVAGGVQGFSNAANCQNCADEDGTLPVHATNLRNQDMRTQLRFFFDYASPGRKKFPVDCRIERDSVLSGAGVAVAGNTYDPDRTTHPNPPAIGAYEPANVVYAPGAEIIRGAAMRGVNA